MSAYDACAAGHQVFRDWCSDCDELWTTVRRPAITVSGPVAAAPPEYGPHAILVLLDGPPPRKFQAGQMVTVSQP